MSIDKDKIKHISKLARISVDNKKIELNLNLASYAGVVFRRIIIFSRCQKLCTKKIPLKHIYTILLMTKTKGVSILFK